jgi:hypothetical protein
MESKMSNTFAIAETLDITHVTPSRFALYGYDTGIMTYFFCSMVPWVRKHCSSRINSLRHSPKEETIALFMSLVPMPSKSDHNFIRNWSRFVTSSTIWTIVCLSSNKSIQTISLYSTQKYMKWEYNS